MKMRTPSTPAYSKREQLQLVLLALVGIISALALVIFFAARLSAPGDGTQTIDGFARLIPEGLPVRPFVPTSDGLRPGDVVIAMEGRAVNDLARQAFSGKWDNSALLNKPMLDYTVLRDGKPQAVQVQLSPFPLGQALLDAGSFYLTLFATALIGIVVFARRPHLWHAQLFFMAALFLLTGGTIYAMWHQSSDLLRGWIIPFEVIAHLVSYCFAIGAGLHFVLIFPRRHPLLERHPTLIFWSYAGIWLIYFGFVLLHLPAAPTAAALLQLDPQASGATALYFPLIFLAVVSNYRQLSDQTERRQMLWMLWGILVAVAAETIAYTIAFFLYLPAQSFNRLIGVFLIVFPISLAMAILRERLFEIELLINRTLVYVPITALLAGIFAATILISQRLFVTVTGQTSDVAVAFATLVVVAVFEPLKSRLQTIVDKRFKEAPNPAKELEAYHEQVRSVLQVIDVDQIARRTLEVTVRAFDATSGAVFLGTKDNLKLVHALGEWKGEGRMSILLESDNAQLGLITLGARKNGLEYTVQDCETLKENLDLVARALALAERMSGVQR